HNFSHHHTIIAVVNELSRTYPVERTKESVGKEYTPWTTQTGRIDLMPGSKPIQIKFRFNNSGAFIRTHIHSRAKEPWTAPEIERDASQSRSTAVPCTHRWRSWREPEAIIVGTENIVRPIRVRYIDKSRTCINIISAVNSCSRIPSATAPSGEQDQ